MMYVDGLREEKMREAGQEPEPPDIQQQPRSFPSSTPVPPQNTISDKVPFWMEAG